MTGIASGKVLEFDLEEAAKYAKRANEDVAKILGINKAARVTTVKPSGTSSLVLGTSSGIHADARAEKDAMKIQFSRLIEYLDFLPVNVISIDKIEADDTIAYIAHTLLDEDVTILSADQDFLQLVNERITVWSPTKKKFYTPRMVIDDYGLRHCQNNQEKLYLQFVVESLCL